MPTANSPAVELTEDQSRQLSAFKNRETTLKEKIKRLEDSGAKDVAEPITRAKRQLEEVTKEIQKLQSGK